MALFGSDNDDEYKEEDNDKKKLLKKKSWFGVLNDNMDNCCD